MPKALLVALLAVFLTGCAGSSYPTADRLSVVTGNRPVPGNTFSVYPLDPEKLKNPEISLLAGTVAESLSLKGLILVDARLVEPDFFVLIDSAIGVGVEEPYERRFIGVVHNTKTGLISHRMRLVSGGSSPNLVQVMQPLVRAAYADFPKFNGSDTVKGDR